MQDKYDRVTLDLFPETGTVAHPACAPTVKAGRPKKEGALSAAERARRYRARKKARTAERRAENIPVSSALIDLSELPAWRRQ